MQNKVQNKWNIKWFDFGKRKREESNRRWKNIKDGCKIVLMNREEKYMHLKKMKRQNVIIYGKE